MKKYCFGVDLGGTTVKIGLFDAEGNMLEKWEIPTRKENSGMLILGDIANAVQGKCRQREISAEQVQGIGLGVPGPVVNENTVNMCVNLGWHKFEVGDTLRALTGIPVKVVNDADAAALGERAQGCGKGCDNLIMFTLGTGVGGGVIVGGKVIEGAHGAGGELGHMVIAEPEEVSGHCNCGQTGCLEQLASATGITAITKKALEEAGEDSILRSKPSFSARDIFDAARQGDPLALRTTDKMMRYLGRAAAFVACVTDPDIIVLGGGVSRAGEYLRAGTEKYYRAYAFSAMKETPVVLAHLGNDAGMIGAVSLVCGR